MGRLQFSYFFHRTASSTRHNGLILDLKDAILFLQGLFSLSFSVYIPIIFSLFFQGLLFMCIFPLFLHVHYVFNVI